ncbi:gephyrin-like molybdotransferase Glp [Specibacter sp. NPDC057265]|uniref:molybdopterin molybdotransferase MoeA n=1 Tax=Specibacter sp. NPDC057265 TaxID=3346075 RepID=UPI003624FA3A
MRRTVVEHQQAIETLLRTGWTRFPDSVLNDAGALVALDQALGRVLAQDLVAGVALPPFSNSQMDGYAISVAIDQPENSDSTESTTFVVGETIAAGAVPAALPVGTAAPIMTGAMVPDGANAVVPVELAAPAQFLAPGGTVELPATTAGRFVRPAGSDVPAGAVAIAAGTVLNAAHLGLAAALGCTAVQLRRRPRVLLLTTGDEVVAPGGPEAAAGLPAGKIYDANGMLLAAALAQAGLEVVHAHMVSDEPAALLQVLDSRLGGGPAGAGVELVLSVGGISAGAFEVVRQALGSGLAHAEMDFVQVALQPGGPQGLGTYRGVPFVAFPGNPVSAYVSVEMFLRPALTALLGAPAPRHRVVAVLAHALTSPAGKHQIRRARYEGPDFEVAASVREVGGESSHLLGALAQANALLEIPAGVTKLQPGAKVEVLLL